MASRGRQPPECSASEDFAWRQELTGRIFVASLYSCAGLVGQTGPGTGSWGEFAGGDLGLFDSLRPISITQYAGRASFGTGLRKK